MRLRVLLDGHTVGTLESTREDGVVFSYDRTWLSDPAAYALSISLPLREKAYPQGRSLPFFAGLLPDGELRRRIADYLHVSETSPLRLLAALAGECAGTVSLVPEGGEAEDFPASDADDGYEELPPARLAEFFDRSDRIPLLAPRGGARLSLAGAQDKLPLFARDGRWFRPRGPGPTTHILKPEPKAFPGLAHVEFLSLRIAASLGLAVPAARVMDFGRPVLVVERFDRVAEADGSITRVHQEDACQALGIMPDRKYQADGGPGFAELAALVRRSCANPAGDLERIVDAALFNFLLGNCDAHGKNFSFLHRGRRIALAPFYDLVATTFWEALDTKLSMRIGGEYRIERVDASAFAAFAAELGVKPAFVRERGERMTSLSGPAWTSVAELPESNAAPAVVASMEAGWMRRARQLGPA